MPGEFKGKVQISSYALFQNFSVKNYVKSCVENCELCVKHWWCIEQICFPQSEIYKIYVFKSNPRFKPTRGAL